MISLTPFPRSTDFPLLSMIKRCFGVCSSNISSPPWCSPTICSMEPVDCEENDGFFFFFDGEFLSPFLDDCWSVLTLFSELSSAWNYTFQSSKWYVVGLGLSDMSRQKKTQHILSGQRLFPPKFLQVLSIVDFKKINKLKNSKKSMRKILNWLCMKY